MHAQAHTEHLNFARCVNRGFFSLRSLLFVALVRAINDFCFFFFIFRPFGLFVLLRVMWIFFPELMAVAIPGKNDKNKHQVNVHV